MLKRRLFTMLTVIMVLGFVSSVSAATTLKKLGRSPFYRPGVSSAADLKNLVNNRTADLQTGFAKAGYPDLYPAFMEQFPTAQIVPVKVSPGETFRWMLFKSKKKGAVAVLKDVTWSGAAPFNAYRFDIDKDGKRYEFLVPALCGNVTLKNIAMIPAPAPAPVAAPAPPPVAPTPKAAVDSPPVAPAPKAAVDSPPAAPAPRAAVDSPPVAPAPRAAVDSPPVAPAPRAAVDSPPVAPAPVAAPAPPPAAKPFGGLLLDVGLSREPDPANYAFARVGYEIPLVDKLYLTGLVGGSLRFYGHDGGSAFTADAMLGYHWLGRTSFGLGAGFWSGKDGQIDLIANLGFLVFGVPDGRNGELFLDVRLPADDLDNSEKFGRYGLGLRLRL